MSAKIRHPIRYISKNLSVVIGIVLIWRGIWYVLDAIDIAYLSGNHLVSGIIGIVLGTLILYIPDRDLKELGRL
jgi:uncharacterized membrane protein HdeD (DUF308 family)